MAADFLDDAVEIQGHLNETALQLHLLAVAQQEKNRITRLHLKSLTHCKGCGFEIEQERQALGGVTLCAECEEFIAQEQRQKGVKR